jgi:hypothetical protein
MLQGQLVGLATQYVFVRRLLAHRTGSDRQSHLNLPISTPTGLLSLVEDFGRIECRVSMAFASFDIPATPPAPDRVADQRPVFCQMPLRLWFMGCRPH